MTMATTIEQQVAMDEALVPSTQRLRIGRSNLRLPSDIQSKESTLQLVYDVLRRCPFFKAFLVTADVPEIYMQEFWAIAYVHQQSIRFKINNKKLIFSAISSSILWGLYHERNIDYAFLIWEDFVYQVKHKNHKKSNKMYYPRFTKVIIHHFMSKDPSILRRNKINWHYVRDDSILSTIKVVSRHQNTQQYGAMLPIELTNDEIRNTKAYKEYYAFATGEAAPKPKASARRKRSGSDTSITPLTATTTQKLTAAVKGKQPAKAKNEGTGSKPGIPDVPIDESEEELSWNSSDDEGADDQVKDEDDDEGDEGDEGEEDADEDKDGDERDDDEENQETTKYDKHDDAEGGGNDEEEGESDEEDDNEETREEENFDHIPHTPKSSEDEGDGEKDQGLNVNEEEHVEEEEKDELYRDVNINQGRGIQATLEVEDTHVTLTPINSDGQQESSSVSSQFVTSLLNPISDVGMESIFVTASSLVAPLHTFTPIMTPSTIATITAISQAPIPPTPIPTSFSEYRQTNPFAEAVSNIPGIVYQYMNQQMTEARIIKEQVKGQVKEQVSKILPRIEQFVNAQLEAKVLTRSSHSSRTSYAVAADLLEMELKKILIEKMEGNKSIQRSDEQRNLYKALVDAYEADKAILDSYGKTVILKRRRDDDDDQDEGPSVGLDRGSKRRREGKEPESASASLETTTRSAGRSTTGSKSRQASASESAFAEESVQTTSQMDEPSYLSKKPPTPDRDWNKTLPAVQGSTQTWISELEKQDDSRSSFNELPDTPLYFSNFIMNRLRVDTLTLEILAGPTFELMKGLCTSLIELEYHLEEVYKETTDQLDWVNPEGQQYPHNLLQPLPLLSDNRCRCVIPFAHFINNDLEYLWGGAFSRKYTTSVTKTKSADYGQIKWIEDLVPRTMWIQEPINYDKNALRGVSHWGRKRQQFYGFAVNRESALDVYSKRRIIAVTDLKIVEWHSYKHLNWITERFTFNVSLRMFTRSIVIQRRVEDLQMGVESYQKRLNLTKPDTYRSGLKRMEAYATYSNPRGFIYQNKDKKNRLMRIDELYKFSDGTLNDVHTALDDHLKGIRMHYLPQTIWRKCNKDRAAAMIQAIDKMLKTRRITRSLKKFVGGRLYEGDFRMLQRTI
uniref:Uncharacterized protein n=1 Tax=Tanacetum cinerariifolium TaxID=118510 RepID=A0A699GTK2_TANCI|nr:hypothetical protein [Tanacetum cinerariifolium]